MSKATGDTMQFAVVEDNGQRWGAGAGKKMSIKRAGGMLNKGPHFRAYTAICATGKESACYGKSLLLPQESLEEREAQGLPSI